MTALQWKYVDDFLKCWSHFNLTASNLELMRFQFVHIIAPPPPILRSCNIAIKRWHLKFFSFKSTGPVSMNYMTNHHLVTKNHASNEGPFFRQKTDNGLVCFLKQCVDKIASVKLVYYHQLFLMSDMSYVLGFFLIKYLKFCGPFPKSKIMKNCYCV